jgi:hypothetical protein
LAAFAHEVLAEVPVRGVEDAHGLGVKRCGEGKRASLQGWGGSLVDLSCNLLGDCLFRWRFFVVLFLCHLWL